MPEDRSFDETTAVENEPSKPTGQKMARPAGFPGLESEPKADTDPFHMGTAFEGSAEQHRWMGVWERIENAGMAKTALRLGTHALMVAVILIVAWVMRGFYLSAEANSTIGRSPSAWAAPPPSPTPTEAPPPLAAYSPSESIVSGGITRLAWLHTDVPGRPRTDVITYTVEVGDTLFGIAEKFGLKPETLLWGNQFVLGDNPHNLRPEQALNILPTDGAYHRWSEGDGLNGVAKYFGVTPEDIIDFPGNHLDPNTIGDWSHPNIEPGTWLIIPGGKREFVSWSVPPGGISRKNPTVAKGFGAGACGAIVDGAVGSGGFIWPAPNHFLSGFDWNPGANHSGIDIDGETGQPVFAADNGVVVYAGWNNWGYGNVVVIDHGNAWQTLYAHLSAFNVGCGSSVYQGTTIGAIGSTGNSTGSHLHFEMLFNGTKVNPHDYLP